MLKQAAMAFTWGNLSRAWMVALATVLALLGYSCPIYADTAITKVKTLVNEDGEGIQDVSGACSLTATKVNASLTLRCVFENKSKVVKRFVFCAMTDLNEAQINKITENGDRELQRPAGAQSFIIKQEGGDNGTLKCETVKDQTGAISVASAHFGCALVELKPGEKKSTPYGEVAGYKLIKKKTDTKPAEQIPFANLKADYFQVTYTDHVDLSSKPNKKFDMTSCTPVKGQANFVSFDQSSVSEDLRAEWALRFQDLIDPYVVYQPINPLPLLCDVNGDGVIDLSDVAAIFAARNMVAAPGDPRDVDGDGLITVNDARICANRVSKQYTLYEDPPCVPVGFPATVKELPPCELRSIAPPPLTSDLNLYFFATDLAPLGTEFPAILSVTTEGDATGIRIQTVPNAGDVFNMQGGVELDGELTLCSTASSTVCLPPKVQESRQLGVTITVRDADTGDILFFQTGEFIRDSEPPKVISYSTGFDFSNNFLISISAQDATTSPVGAELWFSTDGGTSWDQLTLDPTSDIFDGASIPTFVGTTGPFLHGQIIQYFVAIEDMVANTNYFGIGEQVVP
jgi:hypothetical protein